MRTYPDFVKLLISLKLTSGNVGVIKSPKNKPILFLDVSSSGNYESGSEKGFAFSDDELEGQQDGDARQRFMDIPSSRITGISTCGKVIDLKTVVPFNLARMTPNILALYSDIIFDMIAK